MSMSFPDDRVGTYYVRENRTNTQRGFWGNWRPVSSDANFTVPVSHSFRTPTVQGDRITSTFYTRTGARLTTDTPIQRVARGSDRNGAWEDRRVEYISNGLANDLLTPGSLNGTDWNSRVENARSEVRTKLLTKIADQKINMGENIGQAVQTARMIAAPLLELLKAFRFAKQGNWAGVASVLGPPREYLNGVKLSQGWLQYYYGWKPLITDAYSAAELLEEGLGTDAPQFKVTKTKEIAGSYGPKLGPTGHHFDSYEASFKIKEGVTLRTNSTIWGDLNRIGLGNPLATAWELTPLSFVIDWFMPLGNVLASLSAGSGLDFVSGYSSATMEITQTVTAKTTDDWYNASTPWVYTNAGKRVIKYKSFDRVPIYTFPLPRVYVNENPFRNDERIYSALALIRGIL